MNATEFISESNLTTAEILIIKLFTYARPFSCQQPQLLWRILKHIEYFDFSNNLLPGSGFVLCIIALLFVIFTFRTPMLGIFQDPLTGAYGI